MGVERVTKRGARHIAPAARTGGAVVLVIASAFATWAMLENEHFELFAVRTRLEDATLRRDLPGYAEYSGRTRFRLVPFLW